MASDTNVLVRLVVRDDEGQMEAAARSLARLQERGEPAWVSTVVLAELTGVLEALYGYPREATASVLDALLVTPPFEVEHRQAVASAVTSYRQGPAGFADCLIVSMAESAGATPVVTFDRKLLRHPGTQKPE